jgi:hypothetical protein
MNKQTIAAASALMSLSLVVGACGGMEHGFEASSQQPSKVNEYVVLSETTLEDNLRDRVPTGPAAEAVVEADLEASLLANRKLGTVVGAEVELDAEASLAANLKLEAAARVDAEVAELDKSLEGAGKVEVLDNDVAELDLDASPEGSVPRLSGPDPRVDAEQSLEDSLQGRRPSPQRLNQGHAAFDGGSDQDASDPDDFDKAPEYNDNIKTND